MKMLKLSLCFEKYLRRSEKRFRRRRTQWEKSNENEREGERARAPCSGRGVGSEAQLDSPARGAFAPDPRSRRVERSRSPADTDYEPVVSRGGRLGCSASRTNNPRMSVESALPLKKGVQAFGRSEVVKKQPQDMHRKGKL